MVTNIEYCTKAVCIIEEHEKILPASKPICWKTDWYSRTFSKVMMCLHAYPFLKVQKQTMSFDGENVTFCLGSADRQVPAWPLPSEHRAC
jgi:hypothetical protein